mmetsp:Transcript_8636/g.21588  ORF Transcript_8636/g.21588 Transcript_8636/m.21588 type:complete len:305 (-) Transcript_8636:153-1067(-)|eukprot:CAMPEP_0206229486 /NCGR_PEP_ID=MMETSP0047_2-20121206/9731_1 /ASSEMBLY_ACC=CAM_ASM_000192 /TAXON_ID=195065 /ORGANISM="Chroomonas mesostigmatica_cf, Strain CCMP1168" /LENGTH=304 /DNA_ID=CAMNT_0053652805 /DNA_START=54 /DNA_END=968 /DNA_ORIENTATION=+
MSHLTQFAYGKLKIRVMKLNRLANGVHVPREVTVQTLLWGDFADAWTDGSNRKIVATETQKNTVYQLARTHDLSSPEEFGKVIAAHFLNTYDWITKVQVKLVEHPWGRIEIDGKPHKHAFTKTGQDMRFAEVMHARGTTPIVKGGIDNMIVLKTTQSSFEKFVGHPGSHMPVDKSGWTTLGEATDRNFSTSLRSEWVYASPTAPFNDCYDKVKDAFIRTFAGPSDTGVPSPSAQLTGHQMCLAALESCAPHLTDIDIKIPNLHYMPLHSLSIPEHMHDKTMTTFFPIDGPSGYIESAASRRSKL